MNPFAGVFRRLRGCVEGSTGEKGINGYVATFGAVWRTPQGKKGSIPSLGYVAAFCVENSTGEKGINPFAGVCRHLRGCVENSTGEKGINPFARVCRHLRGCVENSTGDEGMNPFARGMSPPSGLCGGLHSSSIFKFLNLFHLHTFTPPHFHTSTPPHLHTSTPPNFLLTPPCSGRRRDGGRRRSRRAAPGAGAGGAPGLVGRGQRPLPGQP
jgi:hypothetical protein